MTDQPPDDTADPDDEHDPWANPAEETSPDDELAAAEARVAARREQDLRARVQAIGAQLDTLRAQHAELAAAVSEDLAPTLAALEQTATTELGQLRAHVTELHEALEQEQRVKNPPVDWIGMSADQARQEWPKLARWLGEVLVPSYEITRDQLPDCWALHTPAVIELSWVRSAHRQSYLAHVHPHITGEWHTRWLPHLLTRLAQLIDSRKCRPGEHRPELGAPLTVPAPEPHAGQPAPLPRAQLAMPEHWWPFYAHAYQADLARRAARVADTGRTWTPAPPTGH